MSPGAPNRGGPDIKQKADVAAELTFEDEQTGP